MTELEQHKKAYALLVGRVDRIITNLEHVDKNFIMDTTAVSFIVGALTGALQDAEEIFLDEDPEEE